MTTAAYQKANPNLRQPKMQHVRHIKPEFYVHEGVNDMTVNARYAETGTWTCCDKHGRFEWKPRMLKRLVMPYDDGDFESLMNEWVQHGFAEKYSVNGETYGQFFNWAKHQGINQRERDSKFAYPAPPESPEPPNGTEADSAHADTCLHVLARAPSEGQGQGQVEQKGKGVGVGLEVALAHDSGVPTNKKVRTKTKDKTKDAKTPSFSVPDLTLPKPTPPAAGNEKQTTIFGSRGDGDPDGPSVGDIPTDSLEGMLDAISDGTFETGVLRDSPDRVALEIACRQAIGKFASIPLVDRSVLARVIGEVMNTFEDADLRWHPAFGKVVNILREGGELRMSLPGKKRLGVRHGDVLGGGSALSFWRAKLESDRELLQKVADIEGVPQTFAQGVEFLQQVEYELQLNNECLPDDLLRVQASLQSRADESQPKSLRSR